MYTQISHDNDLINNVYSELEPDEKNSMLNSWTICKAFSKTSNFRKQCEQKCSLAYWKY